VEVALSVWRRHVGVRLSSVAERRPVRELPKRQLLRQFPRRRPRELGTDRRSHQRERRAAIDHAIDGAAVHHVRYGGFSNGTSLSICGDWVPLGVAFPFASGSNATSASRLPGDLTGTVYGSDRTGGLVVAAARTPADTGTLWAATNMGRVFIAKNADGPGANVTFVRLDTPSTPMRFISHIVADRKDPNVAVISYSGFNALTPQTPGHIFRLVYDPVAETATFTSLDADLGDLPINTIAYDDLRGDLYAATDFGPLILAQGSSSWQIAGVGFPEALMVDLEILPDRRLLVAATHGLGIYSLMLPPVGTAPISTSSKRPR
jgi:hypothetical protein